MFGLVKEKDFDKKVSELSTMEVVTKEIAEHLADYNNEQFDVDATCEQLIALDAWQLKNRDIPDKRAIELSYLITNICKILYKSRRTAEQETE